MKDPSAVELVVVPAIDAAVQAEARAAADGCNVEREKAEEKAWAAEEAAARCVAAHDNADAASRVARSSIVVLFYPTALVSQVVRARRDAAREAVADHDDARSAAEAAALAAREASIRCAAACRHAVAAASAARKAVGNYVAAGGDADAADVLAAQEAANLCIAVLGHAATQEAREAAAKLAVPRADAAAKSARKAAASCEEALADWTGDDDRKFLDSMRGWLMTVAALLVNMTFTAVLRPPSWVPHDFGFDYLLDNHSMLHWKAVSGANLPAAAPSPGPATENTSELVARRASMYLALNTITFATAISVVVVLLKMETSAKTLRYI